MTLPLLHHPNQHQVMKWRPALNRERLLGRLFLGRLSRPSQKYELLQVLRRQTPLCQFQPHRLCTVCISQWTAMYLEV